MCSINRREDENRLGGSCGSRWEAATELMAGRRGGGDDTVTAASLLLREPGAGHRMNGGFRGRSALKGANVPIQQYHTSGPRRGQEGRGQSLTSASSLSKRLYLRVSGAQMEAQEKLNESGAALIPPELLLRRFAFALVRVTRHRL